MQRFVAFLGGVNVGGHRVTMDRLRAEVASLGFANVGTFIASGNVIFTAPEQGDHEAVIAAHLGAELGWAVPTFVRPAAEVIAAAELHPFRIPPEGHTHMVAFCRTAPDPAALSSVTNATDCFHPNGRDLHWLITGGLAQSRLTLAQLARLIGPNTTRNITTVTRLAAMVSER